jgi:hypothetical protein
VEVVRHHLRFPNTDALLAWLIADDALGEQDRMSLALIIRTMKEEAEKQRKAS